MWILYPEKFVLCVGWILQSLGMLEVAKYVKSGVLQIPGAARTCVWSHSTMVQTNESPKISSCDLCRLV